MTRPFPLPKGAGALLLLVLLSDASASAVDGTAALPGGYGFWSEDPASASAIEGEHPVPHISVRLGHARQWTLRVRENVPVRPGRIWTFAAVIAGRRVGWLGGGAGPRVVGIDRHGRESAEPLITRWGRGDWGWKEERFSFLIPDSVAAVTALFYGFGGGEYFVAAARLDTADFPPLPIPASGPTAARFVSEIPIAPGRPGSIYMPGDTVVWRVAAGADPGLSVPYAVRDGYGNIHDTGRIGFGGTIRFPARKAGYYEAILGGSPEQGAMDISGRAGAAVLPPPKAWAPGRNPFGFSGLDEAGMRRLGFTWERPLAGNIQKGGSRRLPRDTAGYRKAWSERFHRRLPATWLNTVEIWNEPNNELEKGTWTIGDFLGMAAATRSGIRARAPKTRIAVNWESLEAFEVFHAAGGRRLYEIACIHPYSKRIFADGEEARSDSPEEDGLPEWLDSARTRLRGKEIWSTEFGWPTAPGHPWSASEIDQARYIVRSALIQLAFGVARVSPFKSEDVPGWGPRHGSLGLRRADLTPKPALAAYSAMAGIIDDLPYAGRLDWAPPGTAALVFGRGRRSVLALWRPEEGDSVAFRLPRGGVRRIGMFGDAEATLETKFRLKPRPTPVFFEVNASPEALAKAGGARLIPGPPRRIFARP